MTNTEISPEFRDMDDSPFLRLEYIYRFSNKPLTIRDSDADHTIRIQLYLLEAYSQVPESFDLKNACYKALIHDLDEVGSGDINRVFKYRTDELHNLIEEESFKMLEESGLPSDIISQIALTKDNTPEGFLVRFFDAYDAGRTLVNQYLMTRRESLREDVKFNFSIMHDILTDYVPEEFNFKLLDYLRYVYKKLCSRNTI